MPAAQPTHGPDDLDPADWAATRLQAHRMLDDILTYVEDIRERPVWRPSPPEIRAGMQEPLPVEGTDLQTVHETFLRSVLPYATGNVHPGFMGWVHGGGAVPGLLAEMLAAGLNANLGGRDHMPIEVERQILRWMRELFRFPEGAGGLFVTGSSMANFMGVLVARTVALGSEVRARGPVPHHPRGPAGHPRRHRQPPHPNRGRGPDGGRHPRPGH